MGVSSRRIVSSRGQGAASEEKEERRKIKTKSALYVLQVKNQFSPTCKSFSHPKQINKIRAALQKWK